MFNKFVSKSQKFLCLGLSLLTLSSITLSANKSQASALNQHVALIAQASSTNPAPAKPSPASFPLDIVTWKTIIGPTSESTYSLLSDGGAVSTFFGRTGDQYATSSQTGNIFHYDQDNAVWNQIGGPGKEFVGDDAGNLYGITPDGQTVAEFSAATHQWQAIGGPAAHLYAGGGSLFATNPTTGNISQYKNGNWTEIGGPGQEFVVSDLGDLYGITPDGTAVFKYLGIPYQWQKIGGPAAHLYAGRFSLYATDPNTGNISKYQGGTSWVEVGGPAKTFTVSVYDHLYSLALNGKTVYEYLGQPNEWAQLSMPGNDVNPIGYLTNIYVGSPYLYATDAVGDLLQVADPISVPFDQPSP